MKEPELREKISSEDLEVFLSMPGMVKRNGDLVPMTMEVPTEVAIYILDSVVEGAVNLGWDVDELDFQVALAKGQVILLLNPRFYNVH